MSRFTGRTALVTGGTSGIGLATAQRLRDEGARVVVTGTDPERLEKAATLDGIEAVANDSADPAAAGALGDEVRARVGDRLDVVFLNAGVGAFQPVGALSADDFDRQMAINVRGPLLQLRAVHESLPEGGSVLFNSSVVNDLAMPGSSSYTATKGAVRSVMRVVAAEMAPRRIRVNAVSPGPVETGFFGRTGLSPEEIEAFGGMVLPKVMLGRFGRPEEVAAAAAFLLSDEASYVTGTELVVDGGRA